MSVLNKILSNRIIKNKFGIYLKIYSFNNDLFYNEISDNQYGIWAHISYSNNIQANSISYMYP